MAEPKRRAVNKEQLGRYGDYAATFRSVGGKRVLEDLKNEYYFQKSYVQGDVFETFRRTCCRDLITRIEWMVSRADEQFDVEDE